MENISLRIDEAHLEAIDEDRADDVSRSKWLRRAAREKLDRPHPSEQIVDLREDVDDLRETVDDLDQRLRSVEDATLLDRIFK